MFRACLPVPPSQGHIWGWSPITREKTAPVLSLECCSHWSSENRGLIGRYCSFGGSLRPVWAVLGVLSSSKEVYSSLGKV